MSIPIEQRPPYPRQTTPPPATKQEQAPPKKPNRPRGPSEPPPEEPEPEQAARKETNQPRGPPGPETLLAIAAVKARTSLSRSAIYRGMKAGTFPTPVPITHNRVGWVASEIDRWVRAQIKAGRRATPT